MHFGIDLGTTHSLIAVFRDGKPDLIPNALGSFMTPSVVALRDGQLVVGEAARQIALSDPGRAAACFKRSMGTAKAYQLGESRYDSVEISALLLRTLKQDAEIHLGVEVREVVISVPAYFNELQRRAVRDAGRIAGLEVLRLINEPTAAALAYGLHDPTDDADQDSTLALVFDLGGGTFDISIVEIFEGVIEVKASAGDAFLGGEDFTEALSRFIAVQSGISAEDFALRPGLLRLAEQAKRQLSTTPEVRITAQLGPHEIDLPLTRSRFEKVTAPLLQRMALPLDRALADAGVQPEDINRLVLVGGASRMPAVRAFAAKRLRQLPVIGVNPDHVVALGTAVQAALVAQDAALDDVVMTDVSAFTLGVETAHLVNGKLHEGFYLPLIERNTVIPASREKHLQALQPGQTKILIKVYQGEAPRVENNLVLGEMEVILPHNARVPEIISLRFTYDVSGLLEVEAKVLSSGTETQILIQDLAGKMSDAAFEAARQRMQSMKISPRQVAENIYLSTRLEAAWAMARATQREQLTEVILEWEGALERQDPAEIQELRQALHGLIDGMDGTHVT